MPTRVSKKMFDAIQRATHIVLVSHKNPDGDTLGSLTAMMHYMTHMRKSYVAFCATTVSPSLAFLPHTEQIRTDMRIWDNPDIDLVIIFDSSSPDYAGVGDVLPKVQHRDVTIINVDHHATNLLYGNLNLVLPKASSTTEIMYDFFVHNDIPITPDMATSLLTGIITDTGNFTNDATTTRSIAIAATLIQHGGNVSLIHRSVLKDKTVGGLKLWGTVLKRIDHHTPLDIIYTYVTKEDIAMHDASDHDIEGLANFLNTLKEGRASMILKEQHDGTYKGSFRTMRDDVDVSAFAMLFGGGGHKKAAGFSVAGPLDRALSHIFDHIHACEAGTMAPSTT